MKQTFNTFCPLFTGFYNTLFEYDREGDDIESYNEENGTSLEWDDFNFDYQDYEKRIGQAFVNRLESELKALLPIKMEFQAINSPKFYNFSNDSIDISVELDLSQLLALIAQKRTLAAQYFKDKYTSCDGFISFHSNDIDTWMDESYILEKPEHRIGALLDCLCNIQDEFECENESTYYWVDSEYWIDYTVKEKQD